MHTKSSIEKTKTKSRLIKFSYVLFTALLIFPLFQYHVSIFGYIGVAGLFVNDTLGLASNLEIFARGEDLNYLGILGVLLLYYPSYYIGNLFNLLINVSLLLISAHYFLKTLKCMDIDISQKKLTIIFVFIVFNFYLLEVLLYPNKEIPLIALTNMFFYQAIIRNNKALIFAIIIAALLIRDGHGVILAATYLLILFAKPVVLSRPILVLLSIFCFFSFISIKLIAELDFLGEYNYVLQRNINLVENPDSVLSNSILNDLPSYIAFPTKVFNHFIGSVLRPQFFDLNSRLYLHGIGLWQNGLAIFLGIIFSFKILLKSSEFKSDIILAAFSVVFCLLVVSAGSYTQARYLLPYIFWLVVFPIYFLRTDTLLIFSLSCIVFSILLFLTGYGSQIPLGIDVAPVPYFE